MEKEASVASLALAGVERMRETDRSVRGRVCALPLLLRGSYYTGEGKWRALAEEDLRALWRGGVHDHIGGGFFSDSGDAEWLRPSFEKRLDDNAVLARLFTEAWEKGHMGFYRAAAEETLDWILRELPTAGGLYRAGQRAAEEGEGNPFLFTPARLAQILGDDEGRHFAECYDITEEGNCGNLSIPNLILNQRWSLIPEGWDDLRERVRLAREERGSLLTQPETPYEANALLLSALAAAARAFADRRYLAAAEALASALAAEEPPTPCGRAARLLALTELYAADYDPARLTAAEVEAGKLRLPEEEAPSPLRDRTLSLAALGLEALWRFTGRKRWQAGVVSVLRSITLHPERCGPESLAALCTSLGLERTPRALLCVSPAEEVPAALAALTGRYAPDLAVLLKTPGRAAALAAAVPWTGELPVGEETLFFLRENGKTGAALRL